jgi:hypothetical protein
MFPFAENEFLLPSKEGFWIRMWLGVEGNRLNWAVMSFSDRDCGVFVLHIDVIEWGQILVTVFLQDCELGELEHPIDKVLVPQKPRVNPWLWFIFIVQWGSQISESGAGIDWEGNGRRGKWGSGIIFSFCKKHLNKFGDWIGGG